MIQVKAIYQNILRSGAINMKCSEMYFEKGNIIIDEKTQNEIKDILNSIKPLIKKNTVSRIKDSVSNTLAKNGWIMKNYLSLDSRIYISFFRNDVGLCIQTGNVSRVYADIMKLQALYADKKIKAGIIILPKKETAKKLGSNMANYERLNKELSIFKKVITLPLIVYGFEEEEK